MSSNNKTPLPEIDLARLLGHTSASLLPPTKSAAGPVAEHSRKSTKVKQKALEKLVTTAGSEDHSCAFQTERQAVEQTPSLSSLANAGKSIPVTCDSTNSCNNDETNLQDEPSSAIMEGSSVVKPKLLFGNKQEETSSEQEENIADTQELPQTSAAVVHTPKRRRFRTIPSSTDSSQDDMTLAEMKFLVNRLDAAGQHQESSLSPTSRSLSFGAENVDPRDLKEANTVAKAQTATAAAAASGIVSSTLNRCIPLTPTPTECSR